MNALERVLLYECIGKGFTIGMHWKGFYFMKALERFYCMNALDWDLQ